MKNVTDNLAGGGKPEEQRDTPRYTLLLRSAKLVSADGEFLCIVRDVSDSGLKLRLFHPLPSGNARYALENSGGQRFDVEAIWEHEGEAGFRFIDPIDVPHFIAENGPFPKRPIRIRIRQDATITIAGNTIPATILDLSREGARIETEPRLAIAQPLRLESRELPPLDATVAWRRHPAYGLVFRQVLSLSDLAQRTKRMQERAQSDD